jgi:hypothetical protein
MRSGRKTINQANFDVAVKVIIDAKNKANTSFV